MKKLTSVILLLACFTQVLQAQNKPPKINKKAINLYNSGLMHAQDGDYKTAVATINRALQFQKNYVDAYLTLGGIYGEMKMYDSSIAAYEEAFLIDERYTRDYKLPYSINLAGLGKFELALEAVNSFLSFEYLSENSRKAGEYRKKTYEFAVDYRQQNLNANYVFAPQNMGDNINGPDLEYYPTITVDGSTFIFTRRLRGRDEDFYISEQHGNNWSLAKSLPGDLNSNYNEGAQNISQDGELLVFTGCNFPEGFGSCDIFFSTKTKKGWSLPQNAGSNINTESWESSPALSPDKRELYFSSTRPDGFGGKDIYVSRLQEDGSWGEPENLGNTINTFGDESCPFIHADNQTMYFTSNGLPGYGGDDLYMVKRKEDGTWGEPKNLGYPINTIESEGSLVVASNGTTAYYASDRADTRGGLDIYTFELREDVQPVKTLWVEGKVFDSTTKNGLPSDVELIDLATGKTFQKIRTNEEGNYLITLPLSKDYAFNVNRKGYLFYSQTFPVTQKKPEQRYQIDIPLQPIEANASVVLNNIFFGVNSFRLETSSTAELDKLVHLLQDNPTVNILITGHTDNTGNAQDNVKLSNNRAKAVVDYIVSKGIAGTRLQHKGMGSAAPVATNDTEEGRATNRRTEMTVLKK